MFGIGLSLQRGEIDYSLQKEQIYEEIKTLVKRFNDLETPSKTKLKVQKIIEGPNLFLHLRESQRQQVKAQINQKERTEKRNKVKNCFNHIHIYLYFSFWKKT